MSTPERMAHKRAGANRAHSITPTSPLYDSQAEGIISSDVGAAAAHNIFPVQPGDCEGRQSISPPPDQSLTNTTTSSTADRFKAAAAR